jgi:hypothetical protein
MNTNPADRRLRSSFCWLSTGLLAALGGCPPEEPAARSAGPDADLAAFLGTPVIELPAAGATALASTRWSGSQTCDGAYRVNLWLGWQGETSSSHQLSFDSRGIPQELVDLSGLTTYGVAVVLRRLHFTETSFDVAYTVEFGTGYAGSGDYAYVFTLSGERSADGRQLTGRRSVGAFYSTGGFPGDHLAARAECTFTVTQENAGLGAW